MKAVRPAAVGLTALLVIMLPASRLARPERQQELPNIPTCCPGVGHINPKGGGPLNQFGRVSERQVESVSLGDEQADFKEAGFTWTRELCFKDSDGDGFTNGFELGDPLCMWRRGMPRPPAAVLMHPGVSEFSQLTLSQAAG
eukprot:gene4469-biopygen6205